MKKSFITLGLLIALMPQLGIFELWKNIFYTVAGLLIVLLVIVPREKQTIFSKPKKEESFVENTPENKEKNAAV